MSSLLQRYREAVQHEHGWDVALTCNACGTRAVPVYKGWTPSKTVGFGTTPTLYADLACTTCGTNLQQDARAELVRLFAEEPLAAANKRLIRRFVGAMIFLFVALPLLLFAGTAAGWWEYGAFLLLSPLAVLTAPAIFYFNYRIAALRQTCPCGAPRYIFMGMLGRSYCYRCRTCGQQLRMRD